MKSTTIKKMALSGALVVALGVAHAASSTYTEAIEAARAQFQKGDYAGAQKTTEEALSLAKTPAEEAGALIRLGLTYKQRKLYPQAREQWVKVLQLPQASAEEKLQAQSGIAFSYSEQEKWSQSRTAFQKFLAMPKSTPEERIFARLVIAGTFLGEKNEVEARRAFSAIAEDTTLDANTRASAYTQVAQSFLRAQEFEKARTALITALGLADVPAETAVVIQAGIADSYKNEGDAAKAQQEFLKAQSMALEQFKALSKAKQLAPARAMVEQLLTFGQVSPAIDMSMRLEIAELLLEEGKPKQGRERFELVLKKEYPTEGLTPEDRATLVDARQSAQLGIAKSYAQEKNKAQAQKILKTLLATEQLHPGVRNGAQTLLKELS